MPKRKPTDSERSILFLKNNEGNEIRLSANQLYSWVQQQAKTDSKSKSSDPQSSSSLSYFGLKNAQDVIYFLNSPAGQTTKTQIGAQLALIAAIKEERRFELQEQQLLKRRTMAFLLFSMLAYREAKARNLNEQIAQQIDKALHKKQKPSIKSASGKSDKTYLQAKQDVLDAYGSEIDFLEKERDIYKQEETELNDEVKKHQEQSAELDEKHRTYDEALDNFDTMETELSETDKLEKQLDSIKEDINQHTDIISDHLENGNEVDARKALHKLNGLHFQAAFLGDLIAVKQGEKKLCDSEGEPIDSCSKAEFVLPVNKKIVKHDDQYYLINENQDIHNMSAEQQADAAKNYQQSKAEMLSIKKLVVNNKENERTHHESKGVELKERKTQMDSQKLLLAEQIQQAQTARATVMNALENPQQLMQAQPTPAVKAALSKSPSASPSQDANSYRKIIFFLRSHEPLSRQQLLEMAQSNPEAKKQLSNQIPLSGPIPHTTMIAMLQNLERFGIDATKPGMTNIQNPLEKKAAAADTYTPPSPLSTKNTFK